MSHEELSGFETSKPNYILQRLPQPLEDVLSLSGEAFLSEQKLNCFVCSYNLQTWWNLQIESHASNASAAFQLSPEFSLRVC